MQEREAAAEEVPLGPVVAQPLPAGEQEAEAR